MAAILHVTRTGHKCHNPLRSQGVKAENIQFGERLQIGAWELFYVPRLKTYIVCRANLTGDHYEFTNFNCAAAKLAELGR
jgi:hypothetical protein